jgi:hypothetical protein
LLNYLSMTTEKLANTNETEASIVAEYNASDLTPSESYLSDLINVTDVNGNFVGYSWDYGDAICIDLDMNETLLHVVAANDYISGLEEYLKGKTVEMRLTEMRGNLKYKLTADAALVTEFPINTTKENTIDRNNYRVNFVLIDPSDNSRLTLLPKPYIVYVK